MLSTSRELRAPKASTSTVAASPGRIPASCVSLNIAVTQRFDVSTIENSGCRLHVLPELHAPAPDNPRDRRPHDRVFEVQLCLIERRLTDPRRGLRRVRLRPRRRHLLRARARGRHPRLRLRNPRLRLPQLALRHLDPRVCLRDRGLRRFHLRLRRLRRRHGRVKLLA